MVEFDRQVVLNTIRNAKASEIFFISLLFFPLVASAWLFVFGDMANCTPARLILLGVLALFWLLSIVIMKRKESDELIEEKKYQLLIQRLKKRKNHVASYKTLSINSHGQLTEDDIKNLISQYPSFLQQISVKDIQSGESLAAVKLLDEEEIKPANSSDNYHLLMERLNKRKNKVCSYNSLLQNSGGLLTADVIGNLIKENPSELKATRVRSEKKDEKIPAVKY
jgi:hypothetical protein